MTLTGAVRQRQRGLTATVTFTSHQAPAQSVDKSACNDWTLNLYLVPQGTGYLIGSAPVRLPADATRTASFRPWSYRLPPAGSRRRSASLLVLTGWQSVIGTLIVPGPSPPG